MKKSWPPYKTVYPGWKPNKADPEQYSYKIEYKFKYVKKPELKEIVEEVE